MSTKKIREVLRVLTDVYKRENDRDEVPGEVTAALAEVEAIERAARQFQQDGDEANVEAWDLMDIIAEESSQS